MRSLVIAIVLLLAIAAGARAATLTTAPFPGNILSAGFAQCAVTNVGTTGGTIKLEILRNDGAVLETDGPFTLPPHHSFGGSFVDLSTHAPVTCRITVPNTVGYRGSFIYVNGNAPPAVIRAQ